MEPLLRTSRRGAIKFCRYLLVSSLLLIRFYVITGEECDEIVKNRGMAAIQAFLPSKIEMHNRCQDLRQNVTECSESCNVAIEEFLENNGGGEVGRVFFRCECTEESAIYNSEECATDRHKLLACPALNFLIQNDNFLTSTEAQEDTSPSKVTPTKETASTKQIIPPGKSCRKARHSCQMTLSCAKAFDNVKDNCLDDFANGAPCSVDCRKALDHIEKNPTAKGLWGCGCDPDGDETTWCGMYGRQGLRKTCEGVKYEELNAANSQAKEFTKDPENSCLRHVISLFMGIFIPALTLTLLV